MAGPWPAAGEPLLLVTAEANAGLVEMPPVVLDEVRPLVGQRRVTVVFDRGGWSSRLFAQILDRGFDILTYRKAPKRAVPLRAFETLVDTVEGRTESYVLADQDIRLRLPDRRRLALRQVTRLGDDGRHQTSIVTSRRDLSAIEVAQRMFNRWRQENFFKYLREEYALDALVEHDVVPNNPQREVPNPASKTLDIELRATRATLAELQAQYGAAALENPEPSRPTTRGFKIAHGGIGRDLRELLQRITDLGHGCPPTCPCRPSSPPRWSSSRPNASTRPASWKWSRTRRRATSSACSGRTTAAPKTRAEP